MKPSGLQATRADLALSLRALGGRLGSQWERERRDTLFMMAPVFLAVAAHMRWLPHWVSAAFIVPFCWRLGLLFSGRWLPRASVRWAGAAAAVAGVWAQYGTLVGRDPGIALLVLFLGLKLMEVRANRDLFVVIFLAMFLLLTAFLHSQSIGLTGLVLLTIVGLVAAMLTMQYRQLEAPIRQRLRKAVAIVLQALPLAAVMFLLFPRASGPLWSSDGVSLMATTGLNDSMTPGALSELAESREIAFRVTFASATPHPGILYWRGPTFGDFDGTTWRPLSAADRASVPADRLEAEADRREASGGASSSATQSRLRYVVEQPHARRGWFFALEMPVSVIPPAGVSVLMTPDRQLTTPRPLPGPVRFMAESISEWQLGAHTPGESLGPWRALPPGFNPRTIALAQSWRRELDEEEARARAKTEADGSGTRNAPVRFVERALQHFATQSFRYTLRPPRLGRDSVDDFLFGERAGFCEHYASAFVVLMRALDVPARVVTGYQGGEPEPTGDAWIVRQADAHAWAEVWLAGRGWIRVDPTAAVAPERIERGVRLAQATSAQDAAHSAQPWFEALHSSVERLALLWNRWVVSYDGERQRRLLERFGLHPKDWPELAGALALALGLAIGAIALITLRPRRSKDPVEQAWIEFCERLASTGASRARHETASAYLQRSAALIDASRIDQAREIVRVYNALRFGRPPSAGDVDAGANDQQPNVRHLQRCVRRFRP